MKFLERFVSALLGEQVQFYESAAEVKSVGLKFHGEEAYLAGDPVCNAPRYYGQDFYEAAKQVPVAVGSAPLHKADLTRLIAGMYPKAASSTDSAPRASLEPVKAKGSRRLTFHGEESYTITKTAKKSSVPAPAPDADKAKAEPTDRDAAHKLLLDNPGMSGPDLVQKMRSMGLKLVDEKADVGKPDPNAPSVDEQIQALMLKSPDISGQSLLAAMSSIGIKVVKESDSTSAGVAVLRGEAEGGKYAHIDFKPPSGARKQAQQGLELRKEHNRGGTAVGVARARDIANGKALSPSTIKRMVSFFARHEVDKKGKGFKPGTDGYPSAGLVAWKLWGGDAGKAWCNKVATQMDAADKKESNAVRVNYTVRDSRFLEASRDDGVGPTKFKVALIQEGLGNLRDCYYYTREALENAASTAAFEGKKCYADHPSASEEQDRPERSVRDIIGHFENVHIEEADDGSAKLVADLVMLPAQAFEWSRTLVASAIRFSKKYPDRELVGLSINASGDASPVPIEDFMQNSALPESAKPKLIKAKEMGVTQVRVVSGIKDAISVDLVTEPGCKGKIEEFIEGEK